MPRRLHLAALQIGRLSLPADQAHHARNVLRLPDGAEVELFDDQGRVARATLIYHNDHLVEVDVTSVDAAVRHGPVLTVAAAVPKGERADWMVEKLSELGVDQFVPLAAERSVVLPEGKNKLARWVRLATESAKQSHRAGIMQVRAVASVLDVLKNATGGKWALSTDPSAEPIRKLIDQPLDALTIFVGPEGGWTADELATFAFAKATSVQLNSLHTANRDRRHRRRHACSHPIALATARRTSPTAPTSLDAFDKHGDDPRDS